MKIIDDASGMTAAIAGITADIKQMGSFGMYTGECRPFMMQGYIVKKVSDNGNGISFVTTLHQLF
ncbi:hypothetical protein SAMN05444672_10253 [Bacillus sp. OK838]|nr:hypothetical protein SAMN05444672_10253 [Bacillus sp. OK838]